MFISDVPSFCWLDSHLGIHSFWTWGCHQTVMGISSCKVGINQMKPLICRAGHSLGFHHLYIYNFEEYISFILNISHNPWMMYSSFLTVAINSIPVHPTTKTTKGKGRMPAVHRSQVSWTKMRAQPALVGYNVVNPMTAIPNRGLLGIHLFGGCQISSKW